MPSGSTAARVSNVTLATAARLASASPRKPSVSIRPRSASPARLLEDEDALRRPAQVHQPGLLRQPDQIEQLAVVALLQAPLDVDSDAPLARALFHRQQERVFQRFLPQLAQRLHGLEQETAVLDL